MDQLKVAVVGCGWAGNLQMSLGFGHLKDRFNVIACCGTTPSRRETFARTSTAHIGS